MAFNGSGTFNRVHLWATDKTNVIPITASRMDTEDTGFATGLSLTICRDGQSTITANIPFNSKKITGLGDATAATDAMNRQAGDVRWAQLGAANSLTADLTLTNTGTSASPSPLLILDRDSASPAASDRLGLLRFDGRDSVDATVTYAHIEAIISDATDASADGRIRFATVVAGALTTSLQIGAGVYTEGVTGTDKGAGTINATTLYEDGTALSAKYAALASANTFTADQALSQAANSILTLDNTTSAPADGTALGRIAFRGKDSAGNVTAYADISCLVGDDTDTSEDGTITFRTMQAGAGPTIRFNIAGGLYSNAATGGDQGIGTINAASVYDDGVLLCAPIEEAKKGSYDKAAWEGLAPHDGLVTYEAMKARGYVPNSADSFAAEIAVSEGIPGYWNKAEWEARVARTRSDDKGRVIVDRVSRAETHERLLLALDLAVLAIGDLTARVKALESA